MWSERPLRLSSAAHRNVSKLLTCANHIPRAMYLVRGSPCCVFRARQTEVTFMGLSRHVVCPLHPGRDARACARTPPTLTHVCTNFVLRFLVPQGKLLAPRPDFADTIPYSLCNRFLKRPPAHATVAVSHIFSMHTQPYVAMHSNFPCLLDLFLSCVTWQIFGSQAGPLFALLVVCINADGAC